MLGCWDGNALVVVEGIILGDPDRDLEGAIDGLLEEVGDGWIDGVLDGNELACIEGLAD